MKLSVVVPVYQVEAYVSRCIESILQQSYQNLELILVDDGSTDLSGCICDKYAQKDNRIRVIHKQNAGVVSSRKAGAGIATGEYIVCVDGDDWIEADYIAKFVSAARNTKADVVWSISFYKEHQRHTELCLAEVPDTAETGDWIKDMEPLPEHMPAVSVAGLSASGEWMLRLAKGDFGFQNEIEYSVCCKCIQTQLYRAVQNQVDEGLTRGEDLFFAILLLTEAGKICFCRNDGYHYVQRPASNTNNKSAYTYDKFLLLEETLQKFEKSLSGSWKSLNRIIRGYLTSTYMLYFFGTRQAEGYLYPFKKIIKHSRIAVYGAGSIGENIISYLEQCSDYRVCIWADTNPVDRRCGSLAVQLVSRIPPACPDYILLATNRTGYIRQMRRTLKALGIADDRIVSAFDYTDAV